MILCVKRLGRWLLYGLASLSLLLCVATAGTWLWSYSQYDRLSYREKPVTITGIGHWIQLESYCGSVEFYSGWFNLADFDDYSVYGEWRDGLTHYARSVDADDEEARDSIWRWNIGKMGDWSHVGVRYARFRPGANPYSASGLYETDFCVQYWLPTLVFAILPGFMSFSSLRRRLRRRYRRRHGLCIHCGYDLRATPKRCPECGAET